VNHWFSISLFVLAFLVPPRPLRADLFRVGFPSLATGFAPSWVTADKGIWKKQGLDVELIYLRGGSRTVSALIGGSVDFIIGSDLGTITAILQGAEIVKLGVTTNTVGYSMIGHPTVKDVRDLKGRTIGITQGRDAAYSRVVKLLADNGMDATRDVKFLTLGEGPAGRLAALSSGVIHATALTPPFDMIAERSGMKNLSKIDADNVGGGLSVMKAGVQKNRPVLLRFLKGYVEGIGYLTGHKQESLRIFSKYTRNPDLQVMAYLYDEITSRVQKDLQPKRAAVRALLDLAALDYPRAQQMSERDHWDTSLIDEIRKSGS
jgi:NitT/TauT family transport system substrate-binding protein